MSGDLTRWWRRRRPQDWASARQVDMLAEERRLSVRRANAAAMHRVHAAALRSSAQGSAAQLGAA